MYYALRSLRQTATKRSADYIPTLVPSMAGITPV